MEIADTRPWLLPVPLIPLVLLQSLSLDLLHYLAHEAPPNILVEMLPARQRLQLNLVVGTELADDHVFATGVGAFPTLGDAFCLPRTTREGLIPRKARKTALKRAKVDDFRFHDLRHTFASYLAMSGATLAEIAEALGHKTLAMVKR